MAKSTRSTPAVFHSRNPHKGRYDFEQLCRAHPKLTEHVRENPAGDRTIDFADPAAVRNLNAAILAAFYAVHNWEIPEGYLCPPIPGRADYIHHLADLLDEATASDLQCSGYKKVLDIGVGASCIYPILGCCSYDWRFVASDVDVDSLHSAREIVQNNSVLKDRIELRRQGDKKCFFKHIIKDGEFFDLSVCNPPFFSSEKEATKSNRRKTANLRNARPSDTPAKRNFGGVANELWCKGGELAFVKAMIYESSDFAEQVKWFSSLVSKAEHVRLLQKCAHAAGAEDVRVVKMQQGQKTSRFIAWTFAGS